MNPLAIAVALAAAGLHATWNVLLKTSADPLQVATRGMGASAIVATPCALLAWRLTGAPSPTLHVWLLAGLSALLECVYFYFLSTAYQRGDLSVVYPLARGTAPLLAVVIGVLILGERLSLLTFIGIACLLGGIWTVARPTAGGPAVVPAVLTGVAIAAYSAVDAVAVHHAPAWLYGWLMWVCTAVLLALWSGVRARVGHGPERAAPSLRLRRQDASRERADTDDWGHSTMVGVMMATTYLLVLTAFSLAPLAVVAPLRETSIVLVAVWGVWRLREREALWARVGGAAGVVLGAILLAM